MSEFDGRQVGIGVVRGVRSFGVDEYGRLLGVAYADVWRPGENVARCLTYDRSQARGPFDRGPLREQQRREHSLVGCSHGFYGYYDGSNDYRSKARISAVVEGYGECLIGTRGFRAEKARIVALCIPGSAGKPRFALAGTAPRSPRRRWPSRRLVDRAAAVVCTVGCAAQVVFTVLLAVTGRPFIGMLILAVALGLTAAVHWWLIRSTTRLQSASQQLQVQITASITGYAHALQTAAGGAVSGARVTPPTVDVLMRVRRNYPDVPVFTSFKAMVAEYPPDKGLEPSPETDPSFWSPR